MTRNRAAWESRAITWGQIMHDDEPTYLRTMTWADLLHALNVDEALRLRLGVQLCPFSGLVEEYTMVDRLGGELNVWPAKWRSLLEADLVGA